MLLQVGGSEQAQHPNVVAVGDKDDDGDSKQRGGRRSRNASQECLGRLLQEADGLLALDAGKVLQKVVQRVAGFQVVEQRSHGHAGADEDRRTAEDLGVAVENGLVGHREIWCRVGRKSRTLQTDVGRSNLPDRESRISRRFGSWEDLSMVRTATHGFSTFLEKVRQIPEKEERGQTAERVGRSQAPGIRKAAPAPPPLRLSGFFGSGT